MHNDSKISKPGTIRLAYEAWPMLRALTSHQGREWLEKAIAKEFERQKLTLPAKPAA